MKKIIKMLRMLIFIGLLLGVSKYILLDYSYVPDISEFAADLEKIRRISGLTMDELPISVNTLSTAKGKLIPWTIMAGESAPHNQYIQNSFQILYKDKSIIIDTPMSEEQIKEFDYADSFNKKNWEKLQKALRKADLILFTHEHWDHTGGLAKSPYLNELIDNVILTKEQIESPLIEEAGFPADLLKKIKPLKYEKYYKVAPGIVFIKAPGHTPGSQMIYVKVQNGNEFLFVGDIVWNFANIKRLRNRSILVTLIGGENRIQLGHLIRWLYDEIYINKIETIHIVPNHDPQLINTCIKRGLIGDNFRI